MSTQRKIIRRAAKDALLNKTDAGPNVFQSRSSAMWREELPALCIYCARETITLQDESPRKYRRELELRIEAGAEGKSDEDVDDQLDELGQQVEQCIGRSDRLRYAKEPSVAELTLSSESLDFAKEGNRVVGGLLIAYTAVYYSDEPDEFDSEPVDDLKRIGTEYDLDGRQAKPERASDLVEVVAA